MIETNLTGYFLMAREVTPRMLAAGAGRIVNSRSTRPPRPGPASCPTGRPGAGTEAMSRVMAADLRGSGVTVNLLRPGGATATGMVPRRPPAGGGSPPLLDPAVMGPPIVWLASPEAAGVHDEHISATEFDDWLSARGSALAEPFE